VRRVIIVVAAVYLGYVTLLTLNIGVAIWVAAVPPSRLTFNSHQWKEKPEGNTRFRMVLDLIGTQSLKGLSRDEVFNKLGPPSSDCEVQSSEWCYRVHYSHQREAERTFSVYFESDCVSSVGLDLICGEHPAVTLRLFPMLYPNAKYNLLQDTVDTVKSVYLDLTDP